MKVLDKIAFGSYKKEPRTCIGELHWGATMIEGPRSSSKSWNLINYKEEACAGVEWGAMKIKEPESS